MEVNAGRFYCRPLRHDSRVGDAPIATQLPMGLAPDSVTEFPRNPTTEWENDIAYHFTVAEQTSVKMLALATVEVIDADHVGITVRPVGNPTRVLSNDDQVLIKVTVADGVEATEKALHQWVEGFLDKKIG